jgi:hypothetical protein
MYRSPLRSGTLVVWQLEPHKTRRFRRACEHYRRHKPQADCANVARRYDDLPYTINLQHSTHNLPVILAPSRKPRGFRRMTSNCLVTFASVVRHLARVSNQYLRSSAQSAAIGFTPDARHWVLREFRGAFPWRSLPLCVFARLKVRAFIHTATAASRRGSARCESLRGSSAA